jgi:hypothetical protein
MPPAQGAGMSRSFLTSILSLVMSAAVLPARDGEDYEALGISAEDLDRMSADELDALDAELDDTLRNPLPPPTHGTPLAPTTDDLGKRPRFTHDVPSAAGDLAEPARYTHATRSDAAVDFTAGPRPTHADDADDLRVAPVEPEGCDTHGDDGLALTAR